MKSSFLMSTLLVVLVASSALAQESGFSSIDKDEDGKVTTSEFKSYAETRLRGFDRMDDFLKRVDADSNGEISKDEFAKRRDLLETMATEAPKPDGDAKKREAGPHVVGDMASDFELQSIGKKIKLSDNKGKPVVVVFSRANW